MGSDWELPVWPAITAPDAAAVLAHYPQAGALAGLDWHSPRPFSAAALVRADGGAFILKRHHPALRSPEALVQEHGFMDHLREGGLCVPEVLTGADGKTALSLGGWTYELHGLSVGQDLYRDRPSWTGYHSLDHARAAGRALARLHLVATGYDAPERGIEPLIASWSILPAADPMAEARAYVAARPAVATYLQDKPWQERLGELLQPLGEGLNKHLAAKPRLWTHNDWHPSNLLWSATGEVATIFDFGLASPSCALHDLATAIERSCIPWLDLQDGAEIAGHVEEALALMEAYASLCPLSLQDRQALIGLLPLVHVEFALSEIDYFAGIVKDPAQADLAWEAYLLGHAHWFASRGGQAFLQALREGMGL
jgi:Ser/Thr protein kinase RdoA (MazF antagonist)